MAIATKQTIQDFYRVASQRDFTRDVQFRVLSISPQGTTIKFDENDLVYARTAALPSRAISPVAAKYMGLNFNLPGVATYPNSENYQLEFYCSANSDLRKKFLQWTNDTFNDANSTGNYLTPTQNSTIDLVQLDVNFEKVNQYQLVGVSIRNVGDIGYTMAEGTGNVKNFGVTLAYHYWREVKGS
jgi:hypothetical protein